MPTNLVLNSLLEHGEDRVGIGSTAGVRLLLLLLRRRAVLALLRSPVLALLRLLAVSCVQRSRSARSSQAEEGSGEAIDGPC